MKKMLLPLLFLFSGFIFGQTGQKITLEDIYVNRKFSARGKPEMISMKDGVNYCLVRNDSLNVYDYENGKLFRTVLTSGELIPQGDTVAIDMGNFEFSQNEKLILFSTDEETIYRYSTQANYFIFDLNARKLISLSDNGKQRLATISPDESGVVFVRDNNLFFKDLKTMKESRITSDGKVNGIINGAPDWVYEEEFGFTKAFEWSPDGRRLLYYRFDESNVKEYTLTTYGELYPEQTRYKYPKAGENNSVVTLHCWDKGSGSTVKIDVGTDPDIYIPRIKWTSSPDVLAFYRLNRHQNKLEILLAKAATGTSEVICTEENKYYVEINDDWRFLNDGKGFILTSEKDGFNHIYHYDMNGKLVRQLTSGNYEVSEILGVDEKSGVIYFRSTESLPVDRYICSVSVDGKKRSLITPQKGTHRAEFSSNYQFFIHTFSDINTPPIVSVNRASGKEIRVIQDNRRLKEQLEQYSLASPEFFSFRTSGGVELNGWILKPADFDPSVKYPVLLTVYGGPGSQTVLNSWSAISMWNRLLAQEGIIIASVDNRGTGGRGEAFKKMTYLQLGKYETEDQVEAAKYLGNLSYIDKTRIGIWGWSYGGFMVLSCLTQGAEYFSTGVAVAPVTNWRYYDNIYTERFMRTPAENKGGYESNSPTSHAGKMKGKLLLIHGLADDNVHAQNSYDFMNAMVKANNYFEMQFYPNCNHFLNTGKNTVFHLYTRMTDFILKNFQP